MIEYPKNKRRVDPALLDKVRQEHCAACGGSPVDAAHIKSRGSGGSDSFENVIPLCRDHHREQHKRGWVDFADRYEAVKEALWTRGWDVNIIQGIRRLRQS